MPVCRCEAFGCARKGVIDPATNSPRGVSVDPRTFKSHQLQDRAAAARDASKRAISAHDADVVRYISSVTLADKVSGVPQHQGSRLWSKSNPDPQDLETLMQHLSLGSGESSDSTTTSPLNSEPSRRSRVDSHIRRLAGIEASVAELADRTSKELNDLSSHAGDPSELFPLQPLLTACASLRSRLDEVRGKQAAVVETKRSIAEQLDEVQGLLDKSKRDWKRTWTEYSAAATTPAANEVNTDHHFLPFLQGVDPVLQVSLFMVVACHIVLNVGRRGCQFMLSMLQYIVQLALMRIHPNLSPREQKLMSDFPVDPRSATAQFHLEGKSIIYAVCPNPKCHQTYKPTFEGDSPVPRYPRFCHHRHLKSGPRCKEPLTKPRVVVGVELQVPIKPFVSFDFKDWVAALTSRPGFEEQMDSSWKGTASPSSDMHDIFDGDFLRGFQGPDGKHFSQGGDEGRYVFSLCVDFFNPYTLKQAGKKASIGIISLVCLNLPPDQRYKPENMFLAGIIPGPHEPPLTATNHYLSPLIDDFLDFWAPGVRFSRTHLHPSGRLVRCALVAVICDLPAARKIGGFASYSHNHFCSICHCTRATHGYGDTRYHSWIRRTNSECRSCAAQYRDASDEGTRRSIFDSSGIRWSELLRLPYFDVARCVVVDAMHNLFLGLIKEHFDGVLGIRLTKAVEAPAVEINFSSSWRKFTPNEQKSVTKLRKYLEAPMEAELLENRQQITKKFMRCHERALAFACAELQCPPAPRTDTRRSKISKIEWVNALLDWREGQHEQRESGATTATACGHVLAPKEMEEIWSDVRTMATPSWLSSVPKNLGSGNHGKVKADQWRVLGTTYLPVSLVRLWAKVHEGDERSERCRMILNVTISLLSAVIIASSRVTSQSRANSYLQHMQAYLSGIQELFPEYNFHPNHHMALHLHEYLTLFGPVHAWWTFPFERIIGLLQRIPTSSKIGELEETISRSYTRSANLRGIMRKSHCPQALQHCRVMFERLLNPQTRDTLISDMLSLSSGVDDADSEAITWNEKTSRSIPDDLHHVLAASLHFNPPRKAQFLSHLIMQGCTYTVPSSHAGNSCILVSGNGIGEQPVPACIQYILELPSPEGITTYVAIQRYICANVTYDPFLQFPILKARMWSTRLAKLEIIPVDYICTHFACLFMKWEDEEVALVLSMSRT